MMFESFKKIVRVIYILGLIAFAIWYGFFLYPIIFDEDEQIVRDSSEALLGDTDDITEEERQFQEFLRIQQQTSTTDLGYMVVEEQYVKGHFHHVGMKVETDKGNVCIRCHGAVPHDKAKAIRGFLNMHAFYLACETCHITPSDRESFFTFRWYDKKTGDVISNPPELVDLDESKYGNYSAKIAPGRIMPDGRFRFLNGKRDLKFVNKYLQDQDKLDETQKSKMKKIIHKEVKEKPLLCEGCHSFDKKSYLPFVNLGYPKRRLHELTSTEVVGLIEKYQEFYIPNLLLDRVRPPMDALGPKSMN